MDPTLTDSELVAQAKAGELSAFEELTNRHERRVYSLAFRMLGQQQDAEDVTQETFLSALEHLQSFREESSFSTWLLRIATHAALKVIRKRKSGAISLEAATEPGNDGEGVPHPEFIADWKDSPAELAHRGEVRQFVEQALAELAPKYRLVFVLRDVQGFSIAETAEALGITEANVKVRLLRARLELRERLTRVLGDPATALAPHSHPG